MSSLHVLQSASEQTRTPRSSGNQFRCLSDSELQRWDAFVSAHPDGLVYHLSSWKSLIESSFAHIKAYFIVLEDNSTGAILGGVPVYLVQSWLRGSRLVSSPFATLSDPLVTSAADLPLLLEGLKLLMSNLRTDHIEIRSFRAGPLVAQMGLERLSFYRQHSLSLEPSIEEITSSFSRTAVRRMVSKALKSGVTVHPITTFEDLEHFYRLFCSTRQVLQLPLMPRRFFVNLWNTFNRSCLTGAIASKDGQPIAAALGLRFNGTFCLEYSGEDVHADAPGANQLVYFHAIERAKELGDHTFHFGRTAATNTGLLQYKRHWGTVESELPVFYLPKAPEQAPETSAAYHLVRSLIRLAPRFAQRPIGNFCYRHLG